jgi:L-ascorbate metabolism protein UlaG (beta-lactamase superfamily)
MLELDCGCRVSVEAGAAKILIDPFLSDNLSWDNGWSGYLQANTDAGR